MLSRKPYKARLGKALQGLALLAACFTVGGAEHAAMAPKEVV